MMVSTTIKGPQFYFQSDNVAHQQIVQFLDGLKASQRGSKSQAITRLLQAGLYLESLDSTLPDLIVRDLEKGARPDFNRLVKLYKVLQISNVDIDEVIAKNEPAPVRSEPEPEPEPRVRPEPEPEPMVRFETEPRVRFEPEPRVRFETEPRVRFETEPRVRFEPEPRVRPEPEPTQNTQPTVQRAALTEKVVNVQSEHINHRSLDAQPSGFASLGMSFTD